jgi:carboxypeptidase C (cathepsin A)
MPFARIAASLTFALLLASAAVMGHAQEQPRRQGPAQRAEQQQAEQQRPEQQRAEPRESVLRLLPADALTEHAVDTPSGRITYRATAGTMSLFDQSGERSAAIYYTAYVANSTERSDRPITFGFNGGPGAAAAYLTLGVVGPRVVDFPGHDPTGARLTDNPYTWLAFTDLVMIDPVGTGWSRAAKPDSAGHFYSTQADAQAVAKVIALYVAKNGRAASPKYLLGESYGGFRAAKVAAVLAHEQGITVSGITMLSPLLEGPLTFGSNRFPLGAALQLPSLAAAELERKGAFSKQALAEAERFALSDYLTTLAGPPLQGEAAKNFYARVAQLTGIPEETVAKSRGFIRDTYLKHLQSAEGKIVSRYDATFAVPDPYPEQEAAHGPDPLLGGLTRAFGGLYSVYAREELGFKTEMTYILLSSDISGKWDWGSHGGSRASASVTDELRELLALVPSFRLLIAHGYSDMVTPYAASRYVLDHLPAIGGPGRAQLALYRGGHMFYIDPQSRKAFTLDAKAFYQSAQ